jgi:predicted aldo/keto reductase-like oxidoreductase
MERNRIVTPLSRRTFVRQSGLLAGGALLAAKAADAAPATAISATLPKRTLGRTGLEVSALALGTWPSGMCRDITIEQVDVIVNEAIDSGITLIDTARNYGKAEEGIGRALGPRRDRVILTTKVWADDANGARTSFERSLRTLRTDHVDILYLHSVGNRDLERALGPDGAIDYLVKQKKAGKCRFLGISGHSKVADFQRLIEPGVIDVVMMAMNFVDRYTYRFEQQVLPLAQKHKMGIACMKVFGGIKGGFGAAGGPNPGAEMTESMMELAVRYAMGLPGIGTLVIGVHTPAQLRRNAEWVRGYRPLSSEEHATLEKVGRQLAGKWGEHYGPVA